MVLTITKMLRKRGVVGKFVEFFGHGVVNLTVEDRATISNMAPEYGAYMGYFPIDGQTIEYLRKTGRDPQKISTIERYLQSNKLFRDYRNSDNDGVKWTGDVLTLDLSSIEPSLAGPKRPHDHVPLKEMKKDFLSCLDNPKNDFKGFGIQTTKQESTSFKYQDKTYKLDHGSVVISSITSCTNTSNPGVMIAAGMIAKKANELGLNIKPYIKTSLSPGSRVAEKYLQSAGLLKELEKLGFNIAGYGCMTCIGNSGELAPELTTALENSETVVAAVLSGNRNFEGRVHPLTKANYLASPPLCVLYALAGTVNIDFNSEPIGKSKDGKEVFLRDLWPKQEEINQIITKSITKEMFIENYKSLGSSNKRWNDLEVPQDSLYHWDEKSTYIHHPPFFQNISQELPQI